MGKAGKVAASTPSYIRREASLFPYSYSAFLAEPTPPLRGTFPIGKEWRTVVFLIRHALQTNVRSQDHGEMFRINTRRFGF